MRSPSHGEPACRQLSSTISHSVALSRFLPWAAALTSCSYGRLPARVEIFPFLPQAGFGQGFITLMKKQIQLLVSLCVCICDLFYYLYRQCNSERTSPSNPHRLGRDHRQWGNLVLGLEGNKTKNIYSNETLHLVALHVIVFSLCDIVSVAKGFCTPHKSLSIRLLWWVNWELSIDHINTYGI